MNELIKEIVKQAGVFYSYQDDVWLATNGDLERFAELIVKECARIVNNTDPEDVEGGDSAVLRAAGEQIQKHFGVEE